jgi:hypothetical protein
VPRTQLQGHCDKESCEDLLYCGGGAASNHIQFNSRCPMIAAPSISLWREVVQAIATGGLSCLTLAVLTYYSTTFRWKGGKYTLKALSLVWMSLMLLLPFYIPLRLGLSASTVAILNFIGAWKAIDVHMQTTPHAITNNGFFPFAVHFFSPVEFKLAIAKDDDSSKKGSIQRPPKALWRKEIFDVVITVAGLSACASIRNVLQACSLPYSSPLPSLMELGRRALILYIEVWAIYFFLSLFSGVFSALLAILQFQAKIMFDQPLLKSTSISDFWSRRWNMLIHGLFKRTVFRPLTRQGFPPWFAGALAFVISGAFHEYAFSLSQPRIHESLGRCLCFFVAQAPIVSAEKAMRNRLEVPWPFKNNAAACTVVWTVLLLPIAPLFLHPLRTSGVLDQIFSLVPRIVALAA